MDWEQLREKTLGEVTTALVSEGAGVTSGFLAAGFLGRQIQDRIKSDDAIVTTTDKIMAWTANNAPKLAMWYLLKKYATVEPGEAVTPMKEATVDAKKAVAGSIIFDTLVRLSSGGKNPAAVTLFGYRLLSGSPEAQKSAQADVQRLIQENSALRTELNKALQRLATPATPPPVQIQPAAPAPVQVQVQPAPIIQAQPIAPPIVRYQPVAAPVVPYTAPVRSAPIRRAEDVPPMPTYSVPEAPPAPVVKVEQVPPAIAERERRFAFMPTYNPPPEVERREKRYGFAGVKGEKDIAAMFGML